MWTLNQFQMIVDFSNDIRVYYTKLLWSCLFVDGYKWLCLLDVYWFVLKNTSLEDFLHGFTIKSWQNVNREMIIKNLRIFLAFCFCENFLQDWSFNISPTIGIQSSILNRFFLPFTPYQHIKNCGENLSSAIWSAAKRRGNTLLVQFFGNSYVSVFFFTFWGEHCE